MKQVLSGLLVFCLCQSGVYPALARNPAPPTEEEAAIKEEQAIKKMADEAELAIRPKFYSHGQQNRLEGRYLLPIRSVTDSLQAYYDQKGDKQEQLTPKDLEKILESVAQVATKIKGDTLFSETITGKFGPDKPQSPEDIRKYIASLAGVQDQFQELKADPKSGLSKFLGTESYRDEKAKRKILLSDDGQFRIRLSKRDGMEWEYAPPRGKNGPELYQLRLDPKTQTQLLQPSRWGDSRRKDSRGKQENPDELYVLGHKLDKTNASRLAANAGRFEGTAARNLPVAKRASEGRRVSGPALAQRSRNAAPLIIKGSKDKVGDGEFYLDKETKFLRDKDGNPVGYEALGMNGGYFFFGAGKDQRPDLNGNAKDRSQWALYGADGRFLAFYNGSGSSVVSLPNRPSKGTPINDLKPEQKEHLDKIIDTGYAPDAALTRLQLSKNQWKLKVDGQDVPAFRLKGPVEKRKTGNAMLDGVGDYVGLDGKRYQFARGRDGRYHTVRRPELESLQPRSSKIEEPPAPGSKDKPESTAKPKEDAPRPPSDQPKPESGSPDQSPNAATLSQEQERWKTFIKKLDPREYKDHASILDDKKDWESLSGVIKDTGAPRALRHLLIGFAAEAAKNNQGRRSAVADVLVDTLRNGENGQSVLNEAAKGLVALNEPQSSSRLNDRLEQLLAAEDLPAGSRVAAIRALKNQLIDNSDGWWFWQSGLYYGQSHENFLNQLADMIHNKDSNVSQEAVQAFKSFGPEYMSRIPSQMRIREKIISNLGEVLDGESSDPKNKSMAVQTLSAFLTSKDRGAIFDLVYRADVGFSPVKVKDGDKLPAVSEDLRKEIRTALEASKNITDTIKSARNSLRLSPRDPDSKDSYDQKFEEFKKRLATDNAVDYYPPYAY